MLPQCAGSVLPRDGHHVTCVTSSYRDHDGHLGEKSRPGARWGQCRRNVRSAVSFSGPFGILERAEIREALDTFNFLRHVMRAIVSVRPKCSHRCVSLKESLVKPVLILKHATRISTEQTSTRTKRFQHIAQQIVQEHLLRTPLEESFPGSCRFLAKFPEHRLVCRQNIQKDLQRAGDTPRNSSSIQRRPDVHKLDLNVPLSCDLQFNLVRYLLYHDTPKTAEQNAIPHSLVGQKGIDKFPYPAENSATGVLLHGNTYLVIGGPISPGTLRTRLSTLFGGFRSSLREIRTVWQIGVCTENPRTLGSN